MVLHGLGTDRGHTFKLQKISFEPTGSIWNHLDPFVNLAPLFLLEDAPPKGPNIAGHSIGLTQHWGANGATNY